MGGWIWLGIIVVTSFVIWRKARRRSRGSRVNNASMEQNLNRGYAAVESNVTRPSRTTV